MSRALGTGTGDAKAAPTPTPCATFGRNIFQENRVEVAHEIADLWFHTFILLAQQGMSPEDVWDELRGRRRH